MQPGVAMGCGKRTLNETRNEDKPPDKAQKILSVCVGQGASDIRGEVSAEIYDDDLGMMPGEHDSSTAAGERFAHIRK